MVKLYKCANGLSLLKSKIICLRAQEKLLKSARLKSLFSVVRFVHSPSSSGFTGADNFKQTVPLP
jgi:hypothetical protein